MTRPVVRVLLPVLVVAVAVALRAQAPPAPQAPGGAPSAQGTPPAGPAAPGGPGGGGRGGGLGNAGVGTTFTPDFTPQPPVRPLTPSEQLQHFVLQPGYKIELVLADPVIAEPTAVAFDGNGRMFVLEDRTYMNDVAGAGTRDPISRISLHEDRDNNGVYETHSIFVDNLIFPRFVMPFGKDAILTSESDHDEVWKFSDTNGDGKADKQELFTTGFGNPTNVEWQTGFLTWTMDNWLYSTVNAFRLRWTPGGVLREPTGTNGAHWGVTQDNDGKQWFQASATGLPGYFQFPVAYGNFNYPDQYLPTQRDFLMAWGAPVRVADMQGGVGVTRMPDGSLNSMTGSAGNDIVRAHRMPADLQGDYIYGEPIGRMLRRSKVTDDEGLTRLQNAHLYSEFLKSTDPLFRPVDITTAPDGTLYITDMYRGIIQEAQFLGLNGAQPSYIKQRIDQYQLDKVTDHGRIWRLSYDATPRDTRVPRMLDETPAQLVAHLSHPNGWWRDTAQQLLVLKQDRSVARQLEALVRQRANLLARFHALWTLEGLGALTPVLTRDMLRDAEPRMRRQAIRASETLFKAGDTSFGDEYVRLSRDADTGVAIQAVLTLNTLKVAGYEAAVKTAQSSNPSKGMQLVATAVLSGNAGGRGGAAGAAMANRTPDEVASITRGQQTYAAVCFACHGENGLGTPKPGGETMAPPIANNLRVSGHRDYVLSVLLHGMTGPLGGVTYTDVMIPMNANTDQWIADVASYIRTTFGNNASTVQASDVARVRAASARTTSWTFAELDRVVPKVLPSTGWTATASHNSGAAGSALSLATWSTAGTQETGMWYQIDLSTPVTIAELQFTAGAPGSTQGGPGGAGGRGGGRGGGGAGRGGAAGPGGAPPAASAAPTVPLVYGPREFKVETSLDGTSWTSVATGQGRNGVNLVPFARPTTTRHVRLSVTATVTEDSGPWSMHSVRLFGPGANP